MGKFLLSRSELQEVLESLVPHVYFQPPENVSIQYPCIVYKLDAIQNEHADGMTYISNPRYQITLIDYAPDSEYVDPLSDLGYCSFERYYVSDNLNHFVFSIFC